MTKDLVRRADPGKIALLTGKQHNLIVDRAFRPSSGPRMLENPIGIAHRGLKPKKHRFGKLYENLDQGSSALMDVWAGDPLAETSKQITVWDWFLETGESITSSTKVKVEFINGKWYVIDWRQQARWIEFIVNDGSGFATTDSSVTVNGVTYHDGSEPTPAVTTVYNKSASSDYIFEGADDARGIALHSPADDKYYIVQMECP